MKKLLDKKIAATWTPLFNKANLIDGEREVNIDLRISKRGLLGISLNCRLAVVDAESHRSLYKIKISRREAYRLMQSEIMYKSWRVPKGRKK